MDRWWRKPRLVRASYSGIWLGRYWFDWNWDLRDRWGKFTPPDTKGLSGGWSGGWDLGPLVIRKDRPA